MQATALPEITGGPHLWNTSLLATVMQLADTPNFTETAEEIADQYLIKFIVGFNRKERPNACRRSNKCNLPCQTKRDVLPG